MRAKDISNLPDIPLKRPKGVSETQWNQAKAVYTAAVKAGDKFPELTVAQAALETGWFRHVPAQYNYFGQKASSKEAGNVARTKEVAGNKAYSTSSKFKSYETLDQALQDRVKKWGSKYQNAQTTSEALYSIWHYDPKKGHGVGYATATDYDKKIGSILNMMGSSFSAKPTPGAWEQGTEEPPVENPNYATFDIVSGEFSPVYTEFKEDMESAEIQQEKQDNSVSRDEIAKLEKAYQELTNLVQNSMQPERPTEQAPQGPSDEEVYSAYLEEIPIQTQMPGMENLFVTGAE